MAFFSNFVTFLPDLCVMEGGSIVFPLKWGEITGSAYIFNKEDAALLEPYFTHL